MGYKDFSEGLDLGTNISSSHTLQADGESVNLPHASFIRDADMSRDGVDLVLNGPEGTLTIENYFASADAPDLVAPDGSVLTPELVNSFVRSAPEYAETSSMTDESPVGTVQEVTGDAKITHLDGSVETISIGTPIFQGDVIETSDSGAVNIVFVDETSFAVSEDARLAIDEYVYDPSTNTGSTDFSVLKGVFVFTSGLIGREDPDDVRIDTPVGSIGIRGTIIAGNVNTGEITVVEGAIVLRDFAGNEVTLADQFETAQFGAEGGIRNLGQLSANDVSSRFSTVSEVAPNLFSSINDAASEQSEPGETKAAPDADGSVDENGDTQVDGSVETAPDATDAPVGDGAEAAPVVPVPPPAVPPTGTQTSFGVNTSGLGHEGLRAPTPPPASTTAGEAKTFAPPPPPSGPGVGPVVINPPNDPNIDPNVVAGGTGPVITPPVNTAPVHHDAAPAKFFASTPALQWNYFFNKEFHDADVGDTLTYTLDGTTRSLLAAYSGSGILRSTLGSGTGMSGSIGDENQGWSFDEATGHLILNFDPAYGATPGTAASLIFKVSAIDGDGATSGFYTYNFSHWTPNTSGVAGGITISGQVLYGSANAETITLGGGGTSNNNTIFLGSDGTADTTIDNFILVEGSNNTIYLGTNSVFRTDGGPDNRASIASGAANVGNVVIGSDQNDEFVIGDARNKFYGMDGDDDFIINLTNTPLMAQLMSGGTGLLIDGGHSQFRALDALAARGEAVLNKFNNFGTDGFTEMGHGDSLILQGLGSINFTNINDTYIKGMERINAKNSLANTITLNYEDVVQMTDAKKTLVISLDNFDTLNFDPGAHTFTKIENVSFDDRRLNDANAAPNIYDVYSDGNITLLVTDGATVTGLPP